MMPAHQFSVTPAFASRLSGGSPYDHVPDPSSHSTSHVLLRWTARTAVGTRIWGYFSVGVAALAGASLTPIEGGLAWPWWIFGWVVVVSTLVSMADRLLAFGRAGGPGDAPS